MELYTKLNNNMEKIVTTFNSRMTQYEKELREAATMSSSSSPPDLSTIAREFIEFKAFTWNCLDLLRSQMELLLAGQDRLEMASRRKVLLLHGVPEEKDEQAEDIARAVLSKQMKMSPECVANINVVHRLGSAKKPSNPRPLLLRFSSFSARSEAWKGKTALKGTGITVSEFLTKSRHEVFVAARKHFGVENCWSTEGRIVLLLPDKSRLKVERMSELLVHTSKFPSSLKQSEPANISAPRPVAVAAGAPVASSAPVDKRPPSARRAAPTKAKK